eukprot:TRINITY_DN20294_c0_g1_i2.p1 TRINITY_DN20294_c0_g1~~TRINITY_DN20294_c0_g1_i2.p1  ORF type:complete len:468 (+),score=127.53 TRINITY_DN20294_c0_g1_i2:38-1441(+)
MAAVDGVLFVFFSLLVGLLVQVLWSESRLLQRFFPVPFTVIIFVIGLAWGYCAPKYNNGAKLDSALENLVGINPHVFLQVFIPALLFESGWAMNMHTFKRVIWQCLWLAVVGVVISMMITACLTYYVFPNDWSWNTSLMYGAMSAATDPVAVAAVMKELGAPATLATVIEGESLLNDGTSYVLFSMFLKRAASYQSPGDISWMLVRMSLGSALFGALMGQITAMLLKVNYHRADVFFEIMITLTVPYLTFWVAENPLELSGVLATVLMALVTNNQGRFFVRHGHTLTEFWEHIAFIANTLVFMISGALVGQAFESGELQHEPGWRFLNYLFLNAIRALIIYGSMPLLRRTGYSFDLGRSAVATWGGLRGAVGLAMAIIVMDDDALSDDDRTEVFDFTASLVFFTLCVNGTSCGALLRFLQYDRQTEVRKQTAREARDQLIQMGSQWIDQCIVEDLSLIHISEPTRPY